MSRRRAGWAAGLTGAVVIVAGFAVALVEIYRWPKASIWLVAGAAVLVVLLIRQLDRRRR
jgi:hypothetical protein